VRILYLTDRLSHRGGASNHLLDIVRWMSDKASLTVAAGQTQVDLPEGVTQHRIRGLASSTDDTRGLTRLEALLAEADVIHVQNLMNPTALTAATQTGRAVVTIQDHRMFCPGPGRTLPNETPCSEPMEDALCTSCLPEQDYRERMTQLTRTRAAAVRGAQLVVLSQYMAQELHTAGLPDAAVIPPAVRTSPRPSPAGSGFIMGGRLVHHKAPELAAQAWRQSKVSVPLSVVGLGPLASSLDGTTQMGWLDSDQLRTALASSRALLFPSRWQEPFGILGVEALAMGTPVIAMTSGGMRDWTSHGTIEVQPSDVAGMANAIERLQADPQAAEDLGHAGWTMVKERYSAARLMNRLWSVYEATR